MSRNCVRCNAKVEDSTWFVGIKQYGVHREESLVCIGCANSFDGWLNNWVQEESDEQVEKNVGD